MTDCIFPNRSTMSASVQILQKQALVEKLQSVSKDEYLTSKKEYKDLHDLIVVNIALLEVLEESHPDELKKKEFRQQRERLETKLASVKRVLSCM